jgi:hypothetical protein
VVPSNTLTVLFAAAVPVKVNVWSFVMLSPTLPLSVENAPIVGALGGCGFAPIATFIAVDALLILPAASVALIVKL